LDSLATVCRDVALRSNRLATQMAALGDMMHVAVHAVGPQSLSTSSVAPTPIAHSISPASVSLSGTSRRSPPVNRTESNVLTGAHQTHIPSVVLSPPIASTTKKVPISTLAHDIPPIRRNTTVSNAGIPSSQPPVERKTPLVIPPLLLHAIPTVI